jgi:hypothetical protein
MATKPKTKSAPAKKKSAAPKARKTKGAASPALPVTEKDKSVVEALGKVAVALVEHPSKEPGIIGGLRLFAHLR